ncbi:MAG: aspartate:alanine exchanger family transporter [Thermomicrobiales bacterium]
MTDFLAENPLFLLFLVIAAGYPFGRIAIAGARFGVATTLFAGLAIGALDERLRLPAIIYELGLVIFVYTIGLSSSRGFVRSLRERGLAVAGWTVAAVSIGMAAAAGLKRVFDLEATETAGLLAGGMTNTPALAGVLDYLGERHTGGALETLLAEPVVAYSITYPMAVLGTIGAIVAFNWLWKIVYRDEAARARDAGFEGAGSQLVSRTAEVTQPQITGRTIAEISEIVGHNVLFGWLLRTGTYSLTTAATTLQEGDLIALIGEESDVNAAIDAIGIVRDERLDLSREMLDHRRIFVSNPSLTGKRLSELDLPKRFGAIITRVRRGDLEFLPSAETVLQPGDRVRVVTTRDQIDAVTRFFGDSYRALSEVDILTFSMGIALGLGVGAIPIPLPGGLEFKLGIAGGPLVVALVLGALERTGRLSWTISFNANLTLRQFGLILFLAGIGTRSGFAFRETIGTRHGLALFVAGIMLTAVVTLVALWSSRRLLGMPMGVAIGMLAGLQTQPAVLSYAQEQSRDDLPTNGYAMVFPVAMIAKIIAAQLLLALLM